MRLLLDSHALLWALLSPEKLSARAHQAITAADSVVFFSVASVWELEIKLARGKLLLPENWVDVARDLAFSEMKISSSEASASARLGWHHRDPFDRMLVAQALTHGLRLVTRDAVILGYDVPSLAA